MRISDWSSDVCSSDLRRVIVDEGDAAAGLQRVVDFRRALEGDDLGTEFLLRLPVVEGALNAADRLAFQVFPLLEAVLLGCQNVGARGDRKSTRLNSSH